MGTNYSPKIVTENIVLYFDAANPKSYPGSGTSITDISRNNNNGTLTSGVTYESENKGSIRLNASTHRIEFPEVNLSPPWTTQMTYKNLNSTANTNANMTLFGHTSANNPGWHRIRTQLVEGNSRVRLQIWYQNPSGGWSSLSQYMGPHGSSYVDPALQDEFWINRIITITITVSENNIYRFYMNGELIQTRNRSSSGDQNNGLTVNRLGVYGSTSYPLNGNIYSAIIYNKELTEEEVMQNYQAIKNRFNDS